MTVAEHERVSPLENDARVARSRRLLVENARLLREARDERKRHYAVLREADRKIEAALGTLRRATLRAV